MNVEQIYDQSIKALPIVDRLTLAKLILNDLSLDSIVDYKSYWTNEDIEDIARYSLERASKLMDEE